MAQLVHKPEFSLKDHKIVFDNIANGALLFDNKKAIDMHGRIRPIAVVELVDKKIVFRWLPVAKRKEDPIAISIEKPIDYGEFEIRVDSGHLLSVDERIGVIETYRCWILNRFSYDDPIYGNHMDRIALSKLDDLPAWIINDLKQDPSPEVRFISSTRDSIEIS